MSFAFPSPGHQLTMPEGGGVQLLGVDVGVGVRVVLHLPALPALKIAWISDVDRARLMISSSSITPLKGCKRVLGESRDG